MEHPQTQYKPQRQPQLHFKHLPAQEPTTPHDNAEPLLASSQTVKSLRYAKHVVKGQQYTAH